MSEKEKDWESEAFLWERRTTALRGLVDMLLEAVEHGSQHTTDPTGALVRGKAVKDAFEAMMKREDLRGSVGCDAFKERVLGEITRRFEFVRAMFNAEMKSRGLEKDFEDVLGALPKPPPPPTPRMPAWSPEQSQQLGDYFLEIYKHTAEESPNDILLRALGVYRSFVVHARMGGQVKFVKAGAPDRTLRVRLR